MTVDKGTGDKMEFRYHYDQDRGFCLPFYYKGEGGNDNRFETERACMEACSSKSAEVYPKDNENLCRLPKEHGSCMAMVVMFYYNHEEKACRTFHYGGCQGNGNRFATREECESTCRAASGRGFSAERGPSPDEKTANIGLIVGIVGGCVFAVAVIAAVVLFVVQRKAKTKDRKKVPTEVEMN
ncbi:kunitz-type U19-barytoxin-Tl1a [Chanos chanos]|uniref:Kunitz-type U19-barytoxin-Tl1a n=1 Tax=Chanos chanos TaxID=29144 RepID=A0A6J2UX45_CHACN|nr:kunitz-type U19-barytoxin-Tl1a-like [Chanos chanos]